MNKLSGPYALSDEQIDKALLDLYLFHKGRKDQKNVNVLEITGKFKDQLNSKNLKIKKSS